MDERSEFNFIKSEEVADNTIDKKDFSDEEMDDGESPDVSNKNEDIFYGTDKILANDDYAIEGNDAEDNSEIDKKDLRDIRPQDDYYENNHLLVQSEQVRFPTPESMTDDEIGMFTKKELTNTKSSVVTVKFRTDNNETMTSAFKIHTRIYEVKDRLSSIFKVKANDIILKNEGNECDDLLPLYGLGAEPFGTIEFIIQSNDPKRSLTPGQFRRYLPVVDVITVRIPLDVGGFKDIVVEIENQNLPKEWLGGYRHRLTKTEYHHVAVQTMPRKRSPDLPQLYTRNTQTPKFPFKDCIIETNPCKSTQMWRGDRYIPNETDKIIIGSSDRFQGRQIRVSLSQLVYCILLIKRFFKNFIARNKEKQMKFYNFVCTTNEQMLKEEKVALKSNESRTTRANFPAKRDDFYMLYLMIGKWWTKEMELIKKTKHSEARKAAFINLLEKEIELLSVIDKKRIQAKKDWMKKQELYFLETTARPIIFCNKKGNISSIDTVETQKAREYQEILSSFMRTNITLEQRLEILNTLKRVIKDYGFYEYTNEIISLIERERHLLLLGMKDEQLKELRERTEQLIIHYLHEHIVNPRMNKYQSPNFQKINTTFYQCKYCKKLKQVSDFNVHIKMKSFNICQSCEWIKNIGHQRIDLSPYARLLRQVRESEMENCSYSSVCFVLQVVGMYYLTNNIWNNHSIISENDTLDELRMVRFKKDKDWSPWNCILLTLDESIAHLNIGEIEKVYDKTLLNKIKWKHMRAKNHFLPLIINKKQVYENRQWFDVKDSSCKLLESCNISKLVTSKDLSYFL